MKHEYNKEANDLLHEQIAKALERIETQTTLTNGKVRRLYIYLTAVGAFTAGLGLVELKTVLKLFI